MAHVVKKDASEAFETWRRLCDEFRELTELCESLGRQWREEDGSWSDYKTARRQLDIANARASVAWAQYLVLKHDVHKSEVFDLD